MMDRFQYLDILRTNLITNVTNVRKIQLLDSWIIQQDRDSEQQRLRIDRNKF